MTLCSWREVNTQEVDNCHKPFCFPFSNKQDNLDPMDVRLSAITFSSHARVEFNLRDCPHSEDLLGGGLYHVNNAVGIGGCIGSIRYISAARTEHQGLLLTKMKQNESQSACTESANKGVNQQHKNQNQKT